MMTETKVDLVALSSRLIANRLLTFAASGLRDRPGTSGCLLQRGGPGPQHGLERPCRYSARAAAGQSVARQPSVAELQRASSRYPKSACFRLRAPCAANA